ncbi:hypothetical protein [Bacillus sp. ISL-57]|uniref:hypothetical protein n=1 Tax=Bacillus sp. ISL-57 TaxID=2819135 RepID=UPI001BE824BC|nr:hypothetical protein [Bacillus sp. ISL-57]MBT2718294.1 hypothetical protein [Bacillus sp. ISL-57]
MTSFIAGLFFVTLILLWIVLGLLSIERKKQRSEFEALKNKMRRYSSLYSERAQLANFTLNEANYLNGEVKREYTRIKGTNRFVEKAIKEKVNKKKIRGKRRRKTA